MRRHPRTWSAGRYAAGTSRGGHRAQGRHVVDVERKDVTWWTSRGGRGARGRHVVGRHVADVERRDITWWDITWWTWKAGDVTWWDVTWRTWRAGTSRGGCRART